MNLIDNDSLKTNGFTILLLLLILGKNLILFPNFEGQRSGTRRSW